MKPGIGATYSNARAGENEKMVSKPPYGPAGIRFNVDAGGTMPAAVSFHRNLKHEQSKLVF